MLENKGQTSALKNNYTLSDSGIVVFGSFFLDVSEYMIFIFNHSSN